MASSSPEATTARGRTSRSRALRWGALAALVGAGAVAGVLASRAESVTIHVQTKKQFEAAVAQLRRSGGTIVLQPHAYRQPLVVGPRSARPLRIVGSTGVKVERIVLEHTQSVSLGHVTVRPLAHDAWVRVEASREIDLHHLLVTAGRTRLSATVDVPESKSVTIRRSRFTHCGDQSPRWSNCLRLRRTASRISVVHNWFHDCRGCDFVHGRWRSNLVIRANRMERALPCRLTPALQKQAEPFLRTRASERCGHQDLIELFGGNGLRIEGNHFGVYQRGGAQVYLTGPIDHATISNNVFVGSDPKLPLYHSRMGLLIGSRLAPHLPQHVRVLDNTILTGARRFDGYVGSIVLSPRYYSVPPRNRPVIVNNILGYLETPGRVCRGARLFAANVVVHGTACPGSASADASRYLRGSRIPGATSQVQFRTMVGELPLGIQPPG